MNSRPCLRPHTRLIPSPARGARRATCWLAALTLAGLSTPALGAQRSPISVGVPSSGVLVQRIGEVVTDSRTREWGRDYGGSGLGGSLGGSATATRGFVQGVSRLGETVPANNRSSAEMHFDVHLFGNTHEAARLQADSENEPYTLSIYGATPKTGYQPSSTIFARLAGQTVLSETFTASSFARTGTSSAGSFTIPISRDLASIETPRVSRDFTILGVPITVAAWAGVRQSVYLEVSWDNDDIALDLGGGAQVVAYCKAQGGVGTSFCSAGIAAELRLGTPTIEPHVRSLRSSGISGGIEICSSAIELVLQVYAEVNIGAGPFKIRQRASADYYTWTGPQQCEFRAF